MFGHQDDKPEPKDNQDKDAAADEPEQTASDSENNQPEQAPADESAVNEADKPAIKPGSDGSDDNPADNPSDDTAKPEAAPADDSWQHPGAPLDDDKEPITDIISPAGGSPNQLSYQHQAVFNPSDSGSQPDTGDTGNEELIDIRKHALDDLSPIIDKLDLPPEDKFRILMMMIQSNDNQDLVKKAYEAAHAIEDEKTRGQALFDIVNEINYFTGPHENQPETD